MTQHLYKNRVGESVANQVVRAGVNTNAIQKEINTSNIVTRLYPKGKSDNLDILENYYYNELRPVAYDFTKQKIEDNPCSLFRFKCDRSIWSYRTDKRIWYKNTQSKWDYNWLGHSNYR